jgi:AcrR family transcriptional regulator
MSTPSRTTASSPANGGRPRDSRIDDAVLQATVELLEEVGYLRLTVAAIAERAGTNKPAIYRRWPTKAHLVHHAVFPVESPPAEMPVDGDLRSELRVLVATGLKVLGTPAARAALPGLLAEMNDHPALHADVLARFGATSWGWLEHRIAAAIADGTVRPQAVASTVLEIIAGSTFVATAIRLTEDLDDAWIDRVVDVIMLGIAA